VPGRSVALQTTIEEHLGSPIRVSDLGALLHWTEAHFSRVFKQTFGISPHAYLLRRRIERASRLMIESTTPLSPHHQNSARMERKEMSSQKYAAFEPAAPYFNLVRGALGDLVEGDHFFDIVADDIVYEVLYEFPGWPRVIHGRADLMRMFRGYVDNITLQSADKLTTHKTNDGGVVIEYEIQGTIRATGAKYDNRFCSIIKIENRKIAHWRDYMDSLAAWNALTGQRPNAS
jgi:uncharacterized protein